MWIASKHGFYSIVKKPVKGQPDTGGVWQVRARIKGDLTGLLLAAGLDNKILFSRENDYAYRISVDRIELMKVMDTLEQSIDYDNFKSKIAMLPSQRAKLNAYHSIWAIMARMQGKSHQNEITWDNNPKTWDNNPKSIF